jgi:hypothetical protein
MLGQFQDGVPHTKTKTVCVSKHLQTLFKMQPINVLAHSVCVMNVNPLDFYLWGHSETLVYSGPIGNEDTCDQCIFYAC